MVTAARRAALADLGLTLTGVALALFMWMHMFFVSSILISEQAMWTVARMFEGYYLFGEPYPVLVSLVAAVILSLIVLHAVLALRRFPGSSAQYWQLAEHSRRLRHPDTSAWWLQLVTGIALMFMVGPHLWQMLAHPEAIGPYQSADRVVSGRWWPLYLVLLWCVELHAAFGLYRAAVKWGWPRLADPRRQRQWLNRLKWFLVVFFIGLGMLTLATEIKLGMQHRDEPGRIFQPQSRSPDATALAGIGPASRPGAVRGRHLPAATNDLLELPR